MTKKPPTQYTETRGYKITSHDTEYFTVELGKEVVYMSTSLQQAEMYIQLHTMVKKG